MRAVRQRTAVSPQRPAPEIEQVRGSTDVTLAPDVSRVPAIRREVVEGLGDDAPGYCGLLLTEMLANAIAVTAPGGMIRVRAGRAGSSVVIEVDDPVSAPPRVRAAKLLDEDGRGLQLVVALAAEWGWSRVPGGGKCVWARLEEDDAAASTGPREGSTDCGSVTAVPRPRRRTGLASRMVLAGVPC